MRKLGLTILMSAITILVIGQDDPRNNQQQNTLFGSIPPKGGFIAFSAKPAYVNDQAAYMSGLQAAVVMGRKVNLGFAAYGLLTDVRSGQFTEEGTEYFVEMGYGGFLIEPVLGSHRMVHLTAPVILGGGISTLASRRPWDMGSNYDYTDPEFFFIAEPGVNAELNLFRFMRLGAGVGYRFVGETGVFRSSATNLSGWSGNLTLKLGWF